MVEVHTFRAATMREALRLVHRELGDDAVILQTKPIRSRRLLRMLRIRQQVEVTAGLGMHTVSTAETPVTTAVPILQEQQLLREKQRFDRDDAGFDLTSLPHSSYEQLADLRRLSNGDGENSIVEGSENVFQTDLARAKSPLAERLDSIETLLERIGRSTAGSDATGIPDELFHLYARLIDADVAETPSRELVLQLRSLLSPDELSDAQRVQSLLREQIAAQIVCSGPIQVSRGDRKVVALVGPTGVGKTTTIAKLAANFRLRDGVRLGLVTVDTYRVAAVEQLQTYADIIDLPMKVVTSPPEMRRAIDELSDMDLVLIDTAGRSPRDELKIQELKVLLNAAEVDETHLVLSLVTNMRSLLMTTETFAPVGITSLILTKLDEAAGMGSLLSVAREVRQPVSYITTGQDVPDDIEVAHSDRVAQLVLGPDDRFGRTFV